ncbi:MAG: transcription antitermination factor NusB [Candidatus Eisenbacteria bacterium]|nr:transcription antitermination factor NusB [Candidatus Eisenbacteria bacterium]
MKKRRKARELAFRILYQAEISSGEPMSVANEVLSESEHEASIDSYTRELVRAFSEHARQIDEIISRTSKNWELGRMAATDRNVLRYSVAEILYLTEVPPKVAIDEAIEIARRFGTEDSGKFVNGILDSVAREFRGRELKNPGA